MTIFFIDKWAATHSARLIDIGTKESRDGHTTPQVSVTVRLSPGEQNCRRERRGRSPTSPFSPRQCALPWVANPVQQPVESDPKLFVEAALEIAGAPQRPAAIAGPSAQRFPTPLLGE